MLQAADVVLSLDWPDLDDTIRSVSETTGRPRAQVVHVSCDAHSHRGWSHDHRGLAPADLYLMCETDPAVGALLAATKPRTAKADRASRTPPEPGAELGLTHVAMALRDATRDLDVSYTRLPFRWPVDIVHFRHPLDYLGYDGGSGVGSGPGITVGAALGLAGTGRLAVGVMGDGDFLMGNTALWTAVHYGIPALFVVVNDRSFGTDEYHQRWIATRRERPTENAWIGCRIDEPAIDLAAMARSMGAVGIGPVTQIDELPHAIETGLASARGGNVTLVDVHIVRAPSAAPNGWSQARSVATRRVRRYIRRGPRS
jgi:thiamine pyrophosphate-dependent acetolactate synthase large subunit-like protein